MLRKFLAGLAIASLVLCLAALILWWRSFNHIDHIGMPRLTGGHAELTTIHGTLIVTTTTNYGNFVNQQSRFYPMRQVVAGCLVVPALWLAITIRAMLPRPGDRRRRLLTAQPASPAAPGRNGEGRNGSKM